MENTLYNDENIAKYFNGELDENKIKKMEENLLHNKESEKEIRDFSRLWKKSAELADYERIDPDSDWKKVRQRMGFDRKSKSIPMIKYFSRIAAILILAVGLAYLFNQLIKQFPEKVTNDYLQLSAGNASKEFLLPDNTKVTLNKDAGLFYNSNYGKDNRDVILEGEGFFEVQKNKEVPFKVFVGNSTIEVLGTKFNIKSAHESVVVSVVSGHVAFYETAKKDNRIDLIKDEQSEFDNKKGTFAPKSAMDQNLLAWRTHQLFFKDETAENVFRTVAEYYNKGIDIKGKVDYLQWTFSGEFNNDKLTDVIDDIVSTHPDKCSVKINDKELIISPQTTD